ncbi:hypothetical protein BIW11_02497 [Tropilaelaps mercedesae]|uniref:Uncharacterized protein n=1 Tax=Tropilaelaps mercedesae TaxID=418985 RepID=A0A1V9Y297_9ACAR|nr:hypothetical protein BIW11_02497 [Tropilaelaps mercedesae]
MRAAHGATRVARVSAFHCGHRRLNFPLSPLRRDLSLASSLEAETVSVSFEKCRFMRIVTSVDSEHWNTLLFVSR